MHIYDLWKLMQTSDGVTIFILAALCAVYLAGCVISIYKYLMIRTELRCALEMQQKIWHARRIEDVALLAGAALSMPEMLMRLGAQYWQQVGMGYDLNGAQKLERYQEMLDQEVEEAIREQQKGLAFLGVSAAAAPLVGLFGTIWGLINAFVGIGVAKSADLAVIAPGIAEALLTTLFGLIVAIPALVAFHFLSGKTRIFEQLLFRLVDRLVYIAQSDGLRPMTESAQTQERSINLHL